MSRSKKQFIGLIVLTGLVVLPMTAEAASYGRGIRLARRRVNKEDMTQIYQQLNLSEQQKQSLEKNRKKHHSKIKELAGEIARLKGKLSQELEKPQIDEDKVRQFQSQINSLQTQFNDMQLKGILNVRDILTPQQYDLFYKETR